MWINSILWIFEWIRLSRGDSSSMCKKKIPIFTTKILLRKREEKKTHSVCRCRCYRRKKRGDTNKEFNWIEQQLCCCMELLCRIGVFVSQSMRFALLIIIECHTFIKCNLYVSLPQFPTVAVHTKNKMNVAFVRAFDRWFQFSGSNSMTKLCTVLAILNASFGSDFNTIHN